MEEGRKILLNELHLLKEWAPISLMEDGMKISVKLELFVKQKFGIAFILFVREIERHPSKTESLIPSIFEGNSIDDRNEHSEKEYDSIWVTV